jgi:hypothetical protein
MERAAMTITGAAMLRTVAMQLDLPKNKSFDVLDKVKICTRCRNALRDNQLDTLWMIREVRLRTQWFHAFCV